MRHSLLFRKFALVFLSASVLALSGAGCISINFGGSAVQSGGVYISEDSGEIWTQKVAAVSADGKTSNISTVNVDKMLFHPLNAKLIYLGTRGQGAWVSEDEGETWKAILTSTGTVRAIGLDPTSTQILYIGVGSVIYKSSDAGVTWTTVYTQSVAGYDISAIAVDPFNARHIYAGTSGGTILFSDDSGLSWRALSAPPLAGGVTDLLFNMIDQRLMLAFTPGGIFRSTDRGGSWSGFITPDIASAFPGSLTPRSIQLHAQASGSMLYASGYGLMQTSDGGSTWKGIPLLTKPGEVGILSFAANPFNFGEIYYGTATNFYKTFNGGKDWMTRSLPSSRQPTLLLINQNNTNRLWMGTAKIEQKKKGLFSL